MRNERHRLEALVQLLADDDRMVIVYAPTRSLTEAIARALTHAGHRAAPYHAGLPRERRGLTLEAFLDDRLDVIVATCAFGMGIDKPQIRMVVHWTVPPTPEAYYQEAGRAGRDGEFARCVLLWRAGDAMLHRRQLEVTFPPRVLLERLWRRASRVRGFQPTCGPRPSACAGSFGPIAGRWTGPAWSSGDAGRRHASTAVERYAKGSACRRRALVGYFGERLDAAPAATAAGTARSLRRRRPGGSGAAGSPPRGHGQPARPLGAAMLEPEVLLALARHPPLDGAALADVPGVGAALASRYGGAILRALGGGPPRGRAARMGPRRRALEAWRCEVAGQAGVPDYVVLRDSALDALAACDPADGRALAAVPGPGAPRAREAWRALLRLIAAHPPERYLLPMDQGDAEILERIERGERVFRPASG